MGDIGSIINIPIQTKQSLLERRQGSIGWALNKENVNYCHVVEGLPDSHHSETYESNVLLFL